MASYDKIGAGYSVTRRADARIANQIAKALGSAESVLNVGAGTGSYEPKDRRAVAVEPSTTMIRQRPPGSAPVVQASAEQLPFPDKSFEAVQAILTVHHWEDPVRGLVEMRRVAKDRVIVFTWDQAVWESFWLVREYLPCLNDYHRRRVVSLSDIISVLGKSEVIRVPIPHDCADGFHGAFWRRPEAYLDPVVRSGISSYALAPPKEINEGLRQLATDIENGSWVDHHRDLLSLEELDLGYRLIVSEYGHH